MRERSPSPWMCVFVAPPSSWRDPIIPTQPTREVSAAPAASCDIGGHPTSSRRSAFVLACSGERLPRFRAIIVASPPCLRRGRCCRCRGRIPRSVCFALCVCVVAALFWRRALLCVDCVAFFCLQASTDVFPRPRPGCARPARCPSCCYCIPPPPCHCHCCCVHFSHPAQCRRRCHRHRSHLAFSAIHTCLCLCYSLPSCSCLHHQQPCHHHPCLVTSDSTLFPLFRFP